MKYIRIKPDWHRLDTEHGTFFGLTRQEVEGKAHSAAVRAERAEYFRQIAAEEREAALSFTDARDRIGSATC